MLSTINYLLQLLITFISVICVSHSHLAGKIIDHDRTVVNCGKYKREANQHSCVLTPFNPEGPYFLPDDLHRSTINEQEKGKPLHLEINLVDANDCKPLENMFIHIWHANALGIYSGVDNNYKVPKYLKGLTIGGPGDSGMGPGVGRPKAISNNRACRGYQVTNSEGQVNFNTIIPGWYGARCLHIHVEVFHGNTTELNNIIYVTQIYFHRDLPSKLLWSEPYFQNDHQIFLNDQDGIYLFHGNETTVDLLETNGHYSTSITFGINPKASKKDHQNLTSNSLKGKNI
ncbi:uncharacterized protein LOC128389547 [Panonychus citri]|uniref:uncharacterized protein LOC128389547 n=1 Tax=Panonychus citri TaxID=50023 RepID=UPI002307FB24|nr:uncharacterized protein LOC128389547 [Panonychus citri]